MEGYRFRHGRPREIRSAVGAGRRCTVLPRCPLRDHRYELAWNQYERPRSFGPHSAGHVGTDPDCHKYPLLQKGCLNQVIAARLTRAPVSPVPCAVFREALLVQPPNARPLRVGSVPHRSAPRPGLRHGDGSEPDFEVTGDTRRLRRIRGSARGGAAPLADGPST